MPRYRIVFWFEAQACRIIEADTPEQAKEMVLDDLDGSHIEKFMQDIEYGSITEVEE